MVNLITFGDVNKYLFYPFVGGIVKLLLEFISDKVKKDFTNHPIINLLNESFGFSLALIPLLIVHIRTKRLNKEYTLSITKTTEKAINNNNGFFDNKRTLLILCSLFIYIQKFFTYFIIHNYMTNLWFYDVVFLSIFSWLILGERLYKHQFLCLIILAVISAFILYFSYKEANLLDVCIIFYIELIFCITHVLIKYVIDNKFSVYSYENFIDDILSLDVESVMASFSELLKKTSGFLVFDIYDTTNFFSTKTMFFVPHKNVINSEIDRISIIEKCKNNTYFYNFGNFEIIPDDFKIIVNHKNNKLTNLFDKITTILSLGYVSTSFDINNGILKGSIQGSRLVEYQFELNEVRKNNILYDIYNWIYTDGSHIDKAIIARNVICFQCKYISILDLDYNSMASIQSNYNLYLKDNVKEYLELINKLSEYIRDTLTRTGEYVTKLLDKFKSNIIAIFGFLFTIVLANIVSSNPLDNIFTKDITEIFEIVIICSFFYLYISYKESKIEIEKVLDSYLSLKENYKNILSTEEINEIFNEDKIYIEIKEEIQKKQKKYLIIWLLGLMILFVVVGSLGEFPYCTNLIELFNK